MLDLAFVHPVIITVEIPGRAADDAPGEIFWVGGSKLCPRQDIATFLKGRPSAVGPPSGLGRVGAKLGVGRNPHPVVVVSVKSRAQRRLVDEAEAFGSFPSVAGLQVGVG